MSLYVITNLEEGALRGLPHLAQLLYYKLRARMNFQTGIVGDLADRAVSWLALREDLEAWGGPGVKRDLPSEDRVRRAMGHLIRKGLVASVGSKILLRFRLYKAKTISLAPKKPAAPSTGPKKGRKAKPEKASEACPQGNSVPEAATHQEEGNTLKQPPPTSPSLRPGEDGKAIDPLTPPAREDENCQGDVTPRGAEAQRLSETRHESAGAVGDGPAALRPEDEREAGINWKPHLEWPVDMEDSQRGYIARSTSTLTKEMAQLVLDEWHGATKAGKVGNAWKYFASLLAAVKEQGPLWVTYYAEGVAAARVAERERLAKLAAADAAYADSLRGSVGAMPPGALAEMARQQEAAWRARKP